MYQLIVFRTMNNFPNAFCFSKQLMNTYRKNSQFHDHNTGRTFDYKEDSYIAPHGFDETPKSSEMLLHWGMHLLDEDVYSLLKMVWKEPLDTNFYSNYYSFADCLYTKPYTKIAVLKLGYPKEENSFQLL